jgi:molybdenum cofactor cytidylyltransferase
MISAILLAAGESKRMENENKLLKKIDGISILQYSIKNILGSAIDELIIVLGHEKEIVEKTIEKNKKIKLIYNENYKNGIFTSIKTGLKSISKKTEAFFLCFGDMPNVNQNIYNKIIKSRDKYNKKLKPNLRKEIIIPSYENKQGNPILFSKFMKNEIIKIKNDDEIKKIIELNKEKILNVPIKSDGVILDFDTQNDFVLKIPNI